MRDSTKTTDGRVKAVLNSLKKDPRFKNRIEHIEVLPERELVYGELREPLPLEIMTYLNEKGITLFDPHPSQGDNRTLSENQSFDVPVLEKDRTHQITFDWKVEDMPFRPGIFIE